jgi:hypothetical protein
MFKFHKKLFPNFKLDCFLLSFLSMTGASWLLRGHPWTSGILLFGLDHALMLKTRIMTMQSPAPFYGMYMIVYMLKLESSS